MGARLTIAIGLGLLAACSRTESSDEPSGIGSTGGLFASETEGGKCVPLAEALPTDYTPGKKDAWPACESDDGKFHPFNSSISSSARAAAFDELGRKLFTPDRDPSKQAFLDARRIYEEDEGIGSRVVRRYDPHNDAPFGTDCTESHDVEAYPDYCAGPAKILPIVLDAFDRGTQGKEPRWQAGRLEGALLWFFTISTYKESFSCSETVEDCDSCYGYFDGAGKGIGLGARIKAVDPDAYRAATLGALAVHCWRDVDMAVPPAKTDLREHARTQYDRGVVKGAISVLLDRLEAFAAASGEAKRFHWGFVSTYLHAIDSQLWRDASARTTIEAAEKVTDPQKVDVDALEAVLTALTTCGS